MAITGITSTTERGVRIVTTGQNLTAASATSESIVIDGAYNAAAIRASGTADILLKRCNIHVNAITASASSINGAWLSYNGDSTDRVAATRKLRLQETSVMVKSSARVDFFFSELTNCLISEVDSTRNLNVYTQPGAILNNTRFTGINTWEVVGAPAQAGGLVFDGVKAAVFNYDAGRLDFTRINVSSFTVSSAFLDGGNGGNNVIWMWDPVNFDRTRLGRASANNLYFEGVSASWEFRDRDTAATQNDVLAIYRDDRTTAGTFVERGRYVTSANGRMVGTYDSRLGTTGASQERPTLFLLRQRLVNNATGAFTSQQFSGAAGVRYDIVAVQPRIEVRSYLHQAPSGYGPADNYTITVAQGITNGDFSVNTYTPFNMVTDLGVTVSKATALAYAQLDTLDQLYDRAKAAWRDNDGFPLFSFSGTVLSLGSRNVLVNALAASAYAFNTGTNTITIKSSALAAGAKFKSLTTTGTVTFANGGTITAPFTDANNAGQIIVVGPEATDTVEMRRASDNSLIATRTGAGALAVSPANIGVSVYFERKVGTVLVMSTQTTPVTLSTVNDDVPMFAGPQVAVANVDGMAKEATLQALATTNQTEHDATQAAIAAIPPVNLTPVLTAVDALPTLAEMEGSWKLTNGGVIDLGVFTYTEYANEGGGTKISFSAPKLAPFNNRPDLLSAKVLDSNGNMLADNMAAFDRGLHYEFAVTLPPSTDLSLYTGLFAQVFRPGQGLEAVAHFVPGGPTLLDIETSPVLAKKSDITALPAPLNSLQTQAAALAAALEYDAPTKAELDAAQTAIATAVNTRATQTSVNAIPTNPLLTNDSRLNNLDATVSSRATQTSVNALGSPAQATALQALASANQTEHDATQAAIAALPAGVTVAQIRADIERTGGMLDTVPTLPEMLASTLAKQADLTGLATATNVTNAQTAIVGEINANETKIDAVMADTAAINAKTATLINAPTKEQIRAELEATGSKLHRAMKAAQSAEDQTV